MPWLNVHIALPLAVLAARFIDEMLNRGDLRDDLPSLEKIAPFLYAAVASALAIVVFVIVGPFSIASAGGWILAIVAGVSVYWAYSGYSRKTAMQVAMVGAVAAFAVFTFRAAYLASWGHPDLQPGILDTVARRDHGDVPVEMLVYTQTSGDIPILQGQIDKAARQSGLGKKMPIVVDSTDGYTWPWAWYLRDYTAVSYTTISQGYTPPQGAILLIARGNASNANLGTGYNEGIPYHHRRWFPEEYRGDNGQYSPQDFFKDVFSASAWSNWLNYWVRRDPPATIGTVDGVAFFPKGFGVDVTAPPAGPTVRTDGTQLVIGGSGVQKGQMSGPSDVTFDQQGNIYVADTNNNRVEKYDSQGNFVAAAGGFGGDVTLNQPWSMAVDGDGNVYIADTWNHDIIKLDKDLKQVKKWGSGGQVEANGDPQKLFGPRKIAITPDGNVIITDTGNSRVVEYTKDGDFVRQFGSKGTSGDPLQFSEPASLAVASNGDIYVADFWNKRIVHLDKDLQSKGTIPVDGWGSQAVTDRPYLAVLPDGRLLATDPTNGKVLVFGADGKPLTPYDLPKESGQASTRPVGIASDGTSVLVADAQGSVVRKIPLSEIAK
jgi:sugar lactone lactonase YvrE